MIAPSTAYARLGFGLHQRRCVRNATEHRLARRTGLQMLTQLNPPLLVNTPHGQGRAYLVKDFPPEGRLVWVVFVLATGECISVPDTEIRHLPDGNQCVPLSS